MSYTFPTHKLSVATQDQHPTILVACGSFNPITLAHLQMFESARDYLQNEKNHRVIGGFLSPVHDAYKKEGLIHANHRLEMCKMAAEDSDWLVVDDWEISQEGYSRTLFVLRHFQEEINKATGLKVRVLLLCGADLMISLGKPGVWIPEQVEMILGDYGLVVVEREDSQVPEHIFASDLLYKYRRNIYNVSKYVKNDLSSTKVRHLIRRGYSVKYHVHDTVWRYIAQHRLYVPPEPEVEDGKVPKEESA